MKKQILILSILFFSLQPANACDTCGDFFFGESSLMNMEVHYEDSI